MTKSELLSAIIADLGANYRNDEDVIKALLDEGVEDALIASNRYSRVLTNGEIDPAKLPAHLAILSSNIRRYVKSVYLQRGAEDASSQSLAGQSMGYDNASERMRQDIYRSGKRLVV